MSETTTEYVLAKKDDLVSVADAIREKTGGGSPLGLSDLSSLITDIETGGGVDEILSLFGANAYKIVSNTLDGIHYNVIPASELDNISSIDNIKLLISIDNNYLAGISSTASSKYAGSAYVFVQLNVNGLTRVFAATEKYDIAYSDKGIGYNAYKKTFYLNVDIAAYEVDYINPMTSLVIYNI